jgi:hypothetical protein
MAYHAGQFTEAQEWVLHQMGLHSLAAVNLILGTVAKESDFGTYLRQLGGGPARGGIQMEPATERDIWDRYLVYRPHLQKAVHRASGVSGPDESALELNLAYQIAMCRIHYLRVPEYFPDPNDVWGLARYWKRFYNTRRGAGTENEFVHAYRKYIG